MIQYNTQSSASLSPSLWELLDLTFCASHVEPEVFPVTSLSRNHLTPIIGLLLFIYLLWQENRGEVTQSHQSLLFWEWLAVLLGLRTTAWQTQEGGSYCGAEKRERHTAHVCQYRSTLCLMLSLFHYFPFTVICQTEHACELSLEGLDLRTLI